ncbi:sortase domain-bontaining protein [Kitasatospora sp. NPDC058218]|uniref:class E sortase n=1 Tax=Kitasatospora sp. NPDC058218 TaxID=3346385 RepID=UPI0036DCE5EC
MPAPPVSALALAAAALAVLAGCAGQGGAGAPEGPAAVSAPTGPTAPPSTPGPSASASPAVPSSPATTNLPSATDLPSTTDLPSATDLPSTTDLPSAAATTVRTEVATLAIPSIGLAGLRVIPYPGTMDDGPGTRIQNGGAAATPYGELGGAGPGEVGNFLVAAHRLSAGGPLRDLPSVRDGDVVLVTAHGTEYEYVITGTRTTSFRSQQSLAEQRAAVPGHPGEQAVQPMITISTCATPEDNAAGNRWRDANGNPEHRIDKIGVLRATRPTG